MLHEPGYFVDRSMNEYCCKTILDFIHEHLDDDTISKIDVPDWIKTNFIVSTSEMLKYKLPRGKWCCHLSDTLDSIVSYNNLFEQPGFAEGAVWGSLKLYGMMEGEE